MLILTNKNKQNYFAFSYKHDSLKSDGWLVYDAEREYKRMVYY